MASTIKWALASRWDDNLEGNGTLDLIRTHCVELDTVDRIHVGHHTDEVLDDDVLDNDDL